MRRYVNRACISSIHSKILTNQSSQMVQLGKSGQVISPKTGYSYIIDLTWLASIALRWAILANLIPN